MTVLARSSLPPPPRSKAVPQSTKSARTDYNGSQGIAHSGAPGRKVTTDDEHHYTRHGVASSVTRRLPRSVWSPRRAHRARPATTGGTTGGAVDEGRRVPRGLALRAATGQGHWNYYATERILGGSIYRTPSCRRSACIAGHENKWDYWLAESRDAERRQLRGQAPLRPQVERRRRPSRRRTSRRRSRSAVWRPHASGTTSTRSRRSTTTTVSFHFSRAVQPRRAADSYTSRIQPDAIYGALAKKAAGL